MAANGISTLTIASGSTLTKNVNPPHSNTEIVAPFSAIWSLNYVGALGATNDVSYKLYVTSLGIGSAFTLTSHQTGDFAVTAGNFLYDEYGNSIGIIKGNATIDNYMAKAAAVCGSLSNAIITAATYKGTWNAFTNTPTLTDGVGTLGDAYDTTVAGTSGAYPAYGEQDWRIYDGSVWQRVDKITTTQWTIKPAAGGEADKEARQIAKLDIAEAKRQGKTVALDGTISGSIDPTAPYYRVNNIYDVAQLPTQYSGVVVVDNPNTGGLLRGRPWNPDTVITVIEEGLVLNLDARNLNSWSREPGEDTWYDLSGNNNHATVYGGIAYGEALGGALAFDGSNEQYAQCVPGVYFTSAGYTIQSWVYIISIPNWNRIIDFGSDAGSDNVLLSATAGTSGLPVLWVGPSGSNAQSEVILDANTGWHHVCATWTPTGTVGKVFIDGVVTGTASIPAPAVGVRANCYIGRSNWGYPPGGPDPNFNGGMGAIQIYSRTLSDAEITQNYNTTKAYYGL
jgi:hypothetical protein